MIALRYAMTIPQYDNEHKAWADSVGINPRFVCLRGAFGEELLFEVICNEEIGALIKLKYNVLARGEVLED